MPKKDEDTFFGMTTMDEAEIVGCLVMKEVERGKYRLCFVVVNDAIRGKGIGKQFLHKIIQYAFEQLEADKVTLGVFEDNEAAYRCYEKLGFTKVDEKYYEVQGKMRKDIEMEYKIK